MGPQRFRVNYSQRAGELLAAAFRQATDAGLRAETIAAARAIEQGLRWFADEPGESRGPLRVLGELRWVGILPITAIFSVDRRRREVWVSSFRFAPPRQQ